MILLGTYLVVAFGKDAGLRRRAKSVLPDYFIGGVIDFWWLGPGLTSILLKQTTNPYPRTICIR